MSILQLLVPHTCLFDSWNCQTCSKHVNLLNVEHSFTCYKITKNSFNNEITFTNILKFCKNCGLKFNNEYFLFEDVDNIFVITQESYPKIEDDKLSLVNCLILNFKKNNYIMKNYFVFLWWLSKKKNHIARNNESKQILANFDSILHHYF